MRSADGDPSELYLIHLYSIIVTLGIEENSVPPEMWHFEYATKVINVPLAIRCHCQVQVGTQCTEKTMYLHCLSSPIKTNLERVCRKRRKNGK